MRRSYRSQNGTGVPRQDTDTTRTPFYLDGEPGLRVTTGQVVSWMERPVG